MKLMKNKKGAGFIFLGLIILVLALSIIFINPPEDIKANPIGIKQYSILLKNEQTRAGQLYAEESTRLSAKIATEKLFDTAGLYLLINDKGGYSESPCGSFIYRRYNSEWVDCTPDFKRNYKNYFSESYSNLLQQFDLFPFNYQPIIDFDQGKEDLVITTSSQDEIKVPITTTKDDDQEDSEDEADEGIYPNGILGGYANEKIITCSSGNCFSDVARYYYKLYTQDGTTLPYVWGGESPYTYEKTIEDQRNNPNSIFKGVSVTKTQPGKYSSKFTEPGFDCSGWAWWVGKHSGIKLFSIILTV